MLPVIQRVSRHHSSSTALAGWSGEEVEDLWQEELDKQELNVESRGCV